MAVLGEDARFEEVRRNAGDLGGVASRIFCIELSDVFLCSVGVVDRTWIGLELELDVLRIALLAGWVVLPGKEYSSKESASREYREEIGEEADKGVAEAAEIETLSVDMDMEGEVACVECSGADTELW